MEILRVTNRAKFSPFLTIPEITSYFSDISASNVVLSSKAPGVGFSPPPRFQCRILPRAPPEIITTCFYYPPQESRLVLDSRSPTKKSPDPLLLLYFLFPALSARNHWCYVGALFPTFQAWFAAVAFAPIIPNI